MGIGSILGTIGSLAAAPFTGGTSLAWLPAAIGAGGGLADVLTGAAKGGQQGQQTNDTLKVALANARTSRLAAASKLPGERLNTAAYADMVKGSKPSSVAWGGPGSGLRGEIPQYSGGFHDLAESSPQTKQLSDQVLHDELLSQMQGGPSGPGGGSDMAMPDVAESSTGDKLLGGAGLATSILAALQKGRPPNVMVPGTTSTSDSTHGTGFNPEDPLNANPNWWEQLSQN